MNKALHVLVYLFLALAGAGLWFELQLNAKRAQLTDRNRMQEDYYVKIAKTIEMEGPKADNTFKLECDASAVEAKLEDNPEMRNLLDEYNGHLEKMSLETYNWENQRDAMRTVYVLDAEGKPMMDGTEPMQRNSPEDKMLSSLLESAKNQQERLNSTRDQLRKLREILEKVVEELNGLKPIARQDKVTIVERDAKIAKLEQEKAELEDQITKLKSQIDELNAEITSLKDEVATCKDEIEAGKEEIAKKEKLIEQLKNALKDALQTQGGKTAAGTAITQLSSGEKGKLVQVDNENMFAVVKFSPEAMKELKGDNGDRPLPLLELGVKRTGFKGEAGEFVGRIRLRQEVKGRSLVICDILSNWEQDKLQKDDTVFAD